MALSALLDTPLYTGSALSEEVPNKYPISIDGRPYMIDEDPPSLHGFKVDGHAQETIATLRDQADTSNTPGEATLNPAALWRRTQTSWHRGAGQANLDRPDSDPYRFRSSKGVNPWTADQLTLLPDTTQILASANTNLPLASAGTSLYVGDGNSLKTATSIGGAFAAVTGTPASTVQALASDGYTIYAAYGANGLYATTRGAAAASVYSATPCNLVRYVKGRIIAANGAALHNPITTGAFPTAFYTQNNIDWTWVDATESQSGIYLAGFSGDKSIIYRVTVKSDGTGLDVPTEAGSLPDGEIVRSIQGYVGLLMIGTDTGLRAATINSDGTLSLGARIPTSAAVKCFEPQDRFVWYGLANYDTTSTGLGRADLSVFTNPSGSPYAAPSIVPAYASDLMTTGQGAVNSVVTYSNRRVFTVSGLGVYAEALTLVQSGTLSAGTLSYGLIDPKVALFADLRHDALVGSVTVRMSVDGAATTTLGVSKLAGSTGPASLPCGQLVGDNFEIIVDLAAASSTTGPTVTRTTLRVEPAPGIAVQITAPLLLSENNSNGFTDIPIDILAERAAIRALRQSKRVVTYQEGSASYQVQVTDFLWVPTHRTRDMQTWNGTLVVKMKEITP